MSSIPSNSENMAIQFIRQSSEEEEHDEADIQPTERIHQFFNLNDTLGPEILQKVVNNNFQNSDINNIMKALNSIKYDNAVFKNKNLLQEVKRDIDNDYNSNIN